MVLPEYLVHIGKSMEQRFKPVLAFDEWRIAILRKSDATDYKNLKQVERHNFTHEVFILTEGNADLIICENGTEPGFSHVIQMEKNVVYDIMPSVWHHVILSHDAHIVIFEKADTSRSNSDYYLLSNNDVHFIQKGLRKL